MSFLLTSFFVKQLYVISSTFCLLNGNKTGPCQFLANQMILNGFINFIDFTGRIEDGNAQKPSDMDP